MRVFISRLSDGESDHGLYWTKFKHSSWALRSVSMVVLGWVDALCIARI